MAKTKPNKNTRDIEKTYSKAAFVAKLRRLADSIETDKRFTIQIASQRIQVPASAVFNIEHERSADGEEIEFQLKWERE
jgi:amphi-Trp domain-containing protein